jgi:hypothetical protein
MFFAAPQVQSPAHWTFCCARSEIRKNMLTQTACPAEVPLAGTSVPRFENGTETGETIGKSGYAGPERLRQFPLRNAACDVQVFCRTPSGSPVDRWPGIRLLTSGQGKDLGHEKLAASSFEIMLTAPHSPNRGRRFHAWNCVVVLVLYTLTITGIPVGAGMPSSGCHCDQQARASGRCCCSKKLNALSKSCCSKPTTVKSCCAGKKSPQPVASSCCQAKHPSKTDTGRSVGPCGCDSPVELGLLLNIDPRLPTGPICLTGDTGFCFSIPLGNDLLQAASTAPEVPPPKFC